MPVLDVGEAMINLTDYGYVQAEDDEQQRLNIRESLTTGASDYLTICEQLRFLYDYIHGLELPKDDEENITELIIDAFNMGKKMNSRLAYYKKKYNNDFSGSKGAHLKRLKLTEKRRKMREERV